MKNFKEDIKEILTGVFEPFTVIALLSIFFSGIIVFTLLVGDSLFVAVKDSFLITIAAALFIVFGAYVNHFSKKE